MALIPMEYRITNNEPQNVEVMYSDKKIFEAERNDTAIRNAIFSGYLIYQ
jgi:hypothetical protein